MGQTSKILSWIVILSFVLGILLMAVSSGIDMIFYTGLSLFLLGIVILVVSMIWSAAGWMDKQTRKYFD